VIRVVLEGGERVPTEDDLRPYLADVVHDLAAQHGLRHIAQVTVPVAEHKDALRPQDPGGCFGLRAGDGLQFHCGQAVRTAVIVGGDQQVQVVALVHHLGQGTAGHELGVVAVGGHAQDDFFGGFHRSTSCLDGILMPVYNRRKESSMGVCNSPQGSK
jgi:hypothetical protein